MQPFAACCVSALSPLKYPAHKAAKQAAENFSKNNLNYVAVFPEMGYAKKVPSKVYFKTTHQAQEETVMRHALFLNERDPGDAFIGGIVTGFFGFGFENPEPSPRPISSGCSSSSRAVV